MTWNLQVVAMPTLLPFVKVAIVALTITTAGATSNVKDGIMETL